MRYVIEMLAHAICRGNRACTERVSKQMRPAVGIALALALAACARPATIGESSPTLVASQTATRVFSLLANNHLLVADVTTGAVLAELTLAAPPPQVSQMRALAISRNAQTLYALVSDATGRARVALVDMITLRFTNAIDIGGDYEFRGLAVGPRTGRIYLFANQRGDAVVRVLDPSGTQSTETWLARKSDGRNWYIYQGAVAADETALYLSYHGPDTTGIDRFEIQPTGLLRCSITTRPESGCFVTHGSFALEAGVLIATMAEQPLAALDPLTGARRAEYDLRLEGNHMPEFTVASAIGRIYAVGSCGYTGGLSMVGLSSGRVQVLVASRTIGAVCGERIVGLSDGSLLVVAKTTASVPTPAPGTLVVLSTDGKTLRTIPASAEPMDLLLF
jgi:hypothetical protein